MDQRNVLREGVWGHTGKGTKHTEEKISRGKPKTENERMGRVISREGGYR